MTQMIEARSVSKEYSELHVLEDVSFAAGAGEVVALLGPNGAGKTTLLKCLLGLVRFTGRATIGGLDVARQGKEARRLVGYLPQAPAFPAHLSAGDTLEYYADLRGLRGEDIDARLAALGLLPHADKRVASLSGGLRQRLGLAVALLGDPLVLLMDEPLSSLDQEGRQHVIELIRDLEARDRTVLLSTHTVALLDGIATRALVLVDGRVVHNGAVEDLMDGGGRPRGLMSALTPADLYEEVVA
jgi:ABC-type multidrug transport system ATPase subunit